MDWVAWYRMQPFYSIEGEWRIRQWLHDGRVDFGQFDESDAKVVEEYANRPFSEWPNGSAA
jgi:hypothetical protein